MSKKVSILIPLYNADKYIEETIDSCLKQTYENIEILILDDGSTDKSYLIAKKVEAKYEKIKVFTHKNQGAQVTRNKLFEMSTGEYIQYLDADDTMDENKIKYQMKLLENKDAHSIAFCRWKGFREEKSIVLNKNLQVYKNYDISLNFLIDLWSNLEAVSPHTWLVHRNLVEESKGWNLDLKKNQDGEFFARIVMAADKIFFADNTCVYYRLDSENSISKNISYSFASSLLESIKCYKKIVASHIGNRKVRYALARLLSHYIFEIYPNHKELRKIAEEEIISLGYTDILPTKNNKLIQTFYFMFGSKIMIYLLKNMKNFYKRVLK